MTKRKVRVETENMKTVMKEMSSKIDEIEEMLKNTRVKVEESKKIFDTPTATYFRQKVFDYIDEQKLFMNNDVRPLVEVLGTIANTYEEDFDEEAGVISNNKKNSNKTAGSNSSNTNNGKTGGNNG